MKKSKRRGAPRGDDRRPRESPVVRTRTARVAGIARPLALVVALAVIVYANALRNGFTLDDIPIVAENPVVRSVGNIGAIFGTNYWSRGGTETIGDPTLYRPLTVFTYAIDRAIWGESAAGFHATNVVLHAATTAVVFLIALELLANLTAAFAAAAIFAVHPIHTEAVTSVIGRAEILATLFFLVAFWVLRQRATRVGNWESGIGNRESGTARVGLPASAAIGATLYLLGLFSKESAITLPAVLALDDWLGRDRTPNARRSVSTLAMRYGALAAAAAIYFAFRQHAVSGAPHLWPGFAGVSPGQRILTASRVLMEYVALFVFPRTLQADYWKTDVPIATSLGDPLAALSLALWVAVAVLAVRSLRRDPTLTLAIAWFFITIAPVSNVLFPIGVAKAERILYLPSVGLCLLVGWTFRRLSVGIRWPWAPRLVIAALVVGLGVRTAVRNGDWRDNFTLATATLRTSPSSPLMSDIAAEELVKTGESNRALALLREAVRQAPEMPLIRTHLGLVYYAQGRFDEAIAEYREAIKRHPTEADTHNNLGVAYARVGQLDLAAQSYREALRLKPDFAAAQQNLARLDAARAAAAAAAPAKR